jgi:hypothetical protein
MSEEALRTIALSVRNWGRWGPDDELGTLNYITPERIAAACRLATTGKVFALGIPLDRNGPQSGTRQRFNPIHTMFRDGGDAPKTPEDVKAAEGYGGSDDWIVMPLQCVTQWDSLAHIFYEGKMYNGYDAALVTSSGAAKNSIFKTKDKIVGRGVLLDVARHKGVKALEPGYAITVADLKPRPPRRRSRSCPVIFCSSAPGTCRGISIVATGSTSTSTRSPACLYTPRRGSTPSRSPPSAPTTTRSRSGPRRFPVSATRFTWSRSRTWG